MLTLISFRLGPKDASFIGLEFQAGISQVRRQVALAYPFSIIRKTAVAQDCDNCKTKTYTETNYPLDVPVICNV